MRIVDARKESLTIRPMNKETPFSGTPESGAGARKPNISAPLPAKRKNQRKKLMRKNHYPQLAARSFEVRLLAAAFSPASLLVGSGSNLSHSSIGSGSHVYIL